MSGNPVWISLTTSPEKPSMDLLPPMEVVSDYFPEQKYGWCRITEYYDWKVEDLIMVDSGKPDSPIENCGPHWHRQERHMLLRFVDRSAEEARTIAMEMWKREPALLRERGKNGMIASTMTDDELIREL